MENDFDDVLDLLKALLYFFLLVVPVFFLGIGFWLLIASFIWSLL